MPPDTHPETRDRETVETLLTNLRERDQPETPESERGPYNIDEAGIKHNAKISVLETVLEETGLSYLNVYNLYRERQDTGFTLDRNGAVASIRTDAEINTLKWILNDRHPSDPRTVTERIKHIAEEVTRLENDFRRNPADELVEESHDTPLNSDVAAEILSNTFRNIFTLRMYLNDGETPEEFENNK